MYVRLVALSARVQTASTAQPHTSIVERLPSPDVTVEYPMNVKDAARFLGVSPQTVYLWVERRAVPHLRMGRCIRFLKSDLEPFRNGFKQPAGETPTGTSQM